MDPWNPPEKSMEDDRKAKKPLSVFKEAENKAIYNPAAYGYHQPDGFPPHNEGMDYLGDPAHSQNPYDYSRGYNGYLARYPQQGYGRYSVGGYGGSFAQSMEASTQNGFDSIHTFVQAVNSFATMIDSTFYATYTSFSAMVAVVKQFGLLKDFLGGAISVISITNAIRAIFFKTSIKAITDRVDGLVTSFTADQDTTLDRPLTLSARPFFFFLVLVFGLPFVVSKLASVLKTRMAKPQSISPTTGHYPYEIGYAMAVFPYYAGNPQELSFSKGDIIAVLSKDVQSNSLCNQWWFGKLQSGQRGYFPSSYVEMVNENKIIEAS